MVLDKSEVKVGMKVQDSNGTVGIVRWVGRMEKAQKPPNRDVGTYAAVQFAMPTDMPNRTNGTWEGQEYCSCPPGTVAFIKPRNLDYERVEEGTAAVRKQFGSRLDGWSDKLIFKFLMARKFDMPKVYKMIEDNLKWREDLQPSTDECFPPEMASYAVGIADGVDREGNLLYYERVNGQFLKQFGIKQVVRWHICCMETVQRAVLAHPTAVRVTQIIDLKDLKEVDSHAREFGKAIAAIDQNNYPEHICRLYIINASTTFVMAWKLIRLFVDERTKTKINIHGTSWEEDIEKQVDRKYWASFLGGSNESWLANGGRIGSADESKIRDPETGKLAVEPITEAEMAAASAETPGTQTPQAGGNSSTCAASPVSDDLQPPPAA